MISVVVLTHNRLPFLRDCVESIRANGYADHEIVVVDNASTDGTAEALAGMDDVRVVRFDRDRELAACRNAGIDAARGDIIAFTDDDCAIEKDWLVRIEADLRDHDAVGGVALPLEISTLRAGGTTRSTGSSASPSPGTTAPGPERSICPPAQSRVPRASPPRARIPRGRARPRRQEYDAGGFRPLAEDPRGRAPHVVRPLPRRLPPRTPGAADGLLLRQAGVQRRFFRLAPRRNRWGTPPYPCLRPRPTVHARRPDDPGAAARAPRSGCGQSGKRDLYGAASCRGLPR